VNRDYPNARDEFKVENVDGKVCATRTDTYAEWDLNLKLACFERYTPRPTPAPTPQVVVVTVGPSSKYFKCLENERGVYCPPDSASRSKRVNHDYPNSEDEFIVEMSSGGQICVTRTDHPDPWGMNLQLACTDQRLPGNSVDARPTPAPTPRPSPVVVTVGPSHAVHKCVTVDDDVFCESDAIPMNDDYRKYADTFKIWMEGVGRVCVQRTDHTGHWGMNLQLPCFKRLGR